MSGPQWPQFAPGDILELGETWTTTRPLPRVRVLKARKQRNRASQQILTVTDGVKVWQTLNGSGWCKKI